MSIKQEIQDAIRATYTASRHITQQDLADKYGISRARVGQILKADGTGANMELGVLQKIFPNATIDFSGCNLPPLVIVGDRSTVEINSRNNNGGDTCTAIRAAMDEIMTASNFTPKEKITLWNILRPYATVK